MLYYDGTPITAHYFSTSCGTTTNAAIWDSDPEDTPYLRCLSLQTARSRLSFASEEEFASFIKRRIFLPMIPLIRYTGGILRRTEPSLRPM